MASLTNTAAVTRKILTVIGLTIGASLLLLVIYNVGLGIYRSFVPEKPPAAFVAFGKLPPIVLNEGYQPPKGVTYRIETVTGELEELPADLKVFSIDLPEVKFGDVARTNSWADSLGFQIPPVANTNGIATFAGKTDSRTLKLGITSQQGIIESDYFNNLDVISKKHGGEAVAQGVADKVVDVFGIKVEEYPKDKISYVMYKVDNGKLVEVSGLSATNLIRVNYFRADIDNIPVVYPTSTQAKVWVLASNDTAVAASVDITRIQPYRFSTYPLKGVNKALAELRAGKAIYSDELESSVFDIREVALGYLDTKAYQPFLQPVYIFRGNNDVDAYVGAVADSYIRRDGQ